MDSWDCHGSMPFQTVLLISGLFHVRDILNTYAHLRSTQVIMLEASHSMKFWQTLILKLNTELMANDAAAFTLNG